MEMKKKKYGVMLLCILIMSGLFVAIKNVWIGWEISEKLEKEDAMVFSAFFKEGNWEEGTYLYTLNQDSLQRIANEIFLEISYNKDRTKFIGKMKKKAGGKKPYYTGFEGIAEYDVKKQEVVPLISLNELQELFQDPGIKIDDLYGPQYYQGNYSVYYDGIVYELIAEGKQWIIKEIGEGTKQEKWGVSYIWDKYQENIYVRATTGLHKWKLIKYNLRTKTSQTLLEDVGEFGISPAEDKIIYSAYSDGKIYLYDMMSKKSTLLAMYKEFILEESIEFSPDGEVAFYVEKSYGAIDRESMHKFYIIDLETNEIKMLKNWRREASFYGVDW